MKRLIFSFLSFLILQSTAQAAIRTQSVEYQQGDTTLEGYLAYDDSSDAKRPGILVVHDWMGLGDHVKKRVDQLARLGYIAFAADIYGKGVRPSDQKEAAAQAGLYKGNRPLMRERAQAALKVLRGHPMADDAKAAAIGYCFGGTAALELARSGADLKGVVSFHGGLDTPTPEDAKNIKGKVLVLHGADDPFVPAEQVKAFEDEMRKAGVDWQAHFYGGAVHAFTVPEAGSDPSQGAAYNASADKRSWEAMKQFFDEIF